MKKVEPSLGTNGYQRCRQGKLNLIKKKSGYWSSRQYRKRSQFVTGWGHWMVTKRCRQRNLHEMSYTIKYRVKTRMATGVAVSTERVKPILYIIFITQKLDATPKSRFQILILHPKKHRIKNKKELFWFP